MKLIKVTTLVKKRVKQMIFDLMPEFGYVRITRQGLVIMKKKWWSFKRTTTNITDLFIDVLPRELSNSCKQKGYGDTYERLFANDLYFMLQLKAYKKPFDIVEYIWNKYNLLHREVPIIQVTIDTIYLESPETRYLPVLSPVSNYFIPGVRQLLRRMKKKDSVESLVEKISKILIRHPKRLMEASRFVVKGVVAYA